VQQVAYHEDICEGVSFPFYHDECRNQQIAHPHQVQISYFVIFSTKPTVGSGAKIGCAIYTSTSNRKFLMTQMLSVFNKVLYVLNLRKIRSFCQYECSTCHLPQPVPMCSQIYIMDFCLQTFESALWKTHKVL
jgi:hypothetical protein